MPRIRFDQVSKDYGNGTIAVDRLSLEIEEQEFLVLVGPSGCGKTTSLRLLAGLESISGGDLYLDEQRINEVPPRDRNMAMVFQSYALYPHFTVFENLAFALSLQRYPKPKIQQRVTQVAQQLEIAHLLDRKPGQLSGGQRQRVALGRAMVRNPTAFLMDEPLSNLDAQLRVQARTELAKLHQHLGTTFVYVTHDQVEAMTLGSRIAVMQRGVLQQVDTPQRLYEYPVNRFVASFLGSPPMNFFPARLLWESDGGWVVAAALRLPIPLSLQTILADRCAPGVGVLLGIRPENFYFAGTAPSQIHTVSLSLMVTLIEPLGHEILIYGEVEGETERQSIEKPAIVARLDARLKPPNLNLIPGSSLLLEVDQEHFHLFDAHTERSLINNYG